SDPTTETSPHRHSSQEKQTTGPSSPEEGRERRGRGVRAAAGTARVRASRCNALRTPPLLACPPSNHGETSGGTCTRPPTRTPLPRRSRPSPRASKEPARRLARKPLQTASNASLGREKPVPTASKLNRGPQKAGPERIQSNPRSRKAGPDRIQTQPRSAERRSRPHQNSNEVAKSRSRPHPN